jgi:hypothetical protein
MPEMKWKMTHIQHMEKLSKVGRTLFSEIFPVYECTNTDPDLKFANRDKENIIRIVYRSCVNRFWKL